jgi:DNA-binding CsgD family transcriptional regulator
VGRKVADVELKNKELASLAIQINHKNEMLTSLKKKLNTVKQRVNEQAQRELSELSNQIDEELELEEDWKKFKIHFDQIQQGFIQKMQNLYPDLKPNDLKLCAFLRMNLSTKEIAPLMNISIRGVEIHRYRLRKKLNLNRETNLVEFLMQQ